MKPEINFEDGDIVIWRAHKTCGARVWIETDSEVVLKENEE